MQKLYGANYHSLYTSHWWWRAREEILISEISTLNLPPDSKILDYGCGNALFFPALEKFGKVTGIETDASLVKEGKYRSQIFTDPLGAARYADLQFDLILALDVLEHIENDQAAFDLICKMLAPGGVLLVTVPAMMELWDQHDEINHHYRRYTKAELHSLLASQLNVRKLRYFFHSLYFPKRMISMLNRSKTSTIDQSKIPAPWVNKTAKVFFKSEYYLTDLVSLPFGSSLLAVAKKGV